MRFDGPKQDGDGVRLVVIGGTEATRTNCLNHRLLLGIALAGDEALDRADWNALVSDRARLTPRRQDGEKATVDMRRVRARVPAHLLEMYDADVGRGSRNTLQPAAES